MLKMLSSCCPSLYIYGMGKFIKPSHTHEITSFSPLIVILFCHNYEGSSEFVGNEASVGIPVAS